MTAVDAPREEATFRELPQTGGWVFTTDHKRIAILTGAVALFLFFGNGALALIMRAQLAQPKLDIVSANTYNQLFTTHGSGMIYLVVTPLAIALGVYLVPLQIGAPAIAAPRVAMTGFWLYVVGAIAIYSGWGTTGGAASDGWWSYPPLASSEFTPSHGFDLWLAGNFLAVTAMIMMSACLVWTVLFKRAPGMTMLRLPVFTWSEIVSVFMVLASFPALLAADGLVAVGRVFPSIFDHNTANIGYQHLFWFYGHPVVYVMFFPFVGCVAEVLSTFSGRPFAGYRWAVFSLMLFSALSMAVWGHHMLTTGQVTDNYYQLTSTLLAVPAGIEYFDMIGTLIGGRLRFTAAMHYAVAFIPQFLIGGLTGIMLGTPVIDYHVEDSFFVVAHFHYTLLAGSMFGAFAGIYFWFPKITGVMLREGLGKVQFWLMVVGTNVTFLPMFALGMLGMPRRVATYPDLPYWGPLNLVSSIGAGILGWGAFMFVVNLFVSLRNRRPAPPNPWQAHTLEWATSSPPPMMNFNGRYPIPKITSFTPLLDLRLKAKERAATAVGNSDAAARS